VKEAVSNHLNTREPILGRIYPRASAEKFAGRANRKITEK